ncbi:MAG: hypothetical protein ACREI3_05930 [Nitrospirales bacterium]
MNRKAGQAAWGRALAIVVFVGGILGLPDAGGAASQTPASQTSGGETWTPLQRAKVFLAAGDYRRAVQACQQEVDRRPSAASYLYLTYVYHALDGYLEHLAKTDQWVKVEQAYVNLAGTGPMDLVDPQDVLSRIAKEVIQGSARQQSDVTAAMAVRLDQELVNRLWQEQTAFRKAHPDTWWSSIPDAWTW